MKKFFLHLLIVIFLTECSQSNNQNGMNQVSIIHTIDIDLGLRNISNIPIKCSDFIDSVQFIQLETSKESLIGGYRGVQIMATSEFFYGNLKKFNFTNGKFIHVVGKIGRGPGEYSMAISTATDITNNRVFVRDNWTKQILAYDAENNFIKKIDVADQIRNIGYLGNDNLMLMRDDAISLVPPIEYQIYNINENRVKYTREIIELKKSLKTLTGNNHPMGIGRNCTWYFDNNFQLYESFSDTIFSIDSNGKAIPRFYINRQNHKPPLHDILDQESISRNSSKYVEITKIRETPLFLFIYLLKGINNNPEPYIAIYDKSKQDLKIVPFIGAFDDDITKMKTFEFYNIQGSNDGMNYLNTQRLTSQLIIKMETTSESSWTKESKKLYTLLKSLDPTDNGIIFRYIFKNKN